MEHVGFSNAVLYVNSEYIEEYLFHLYFWVSISTASNFSLVNFCPTIWMTGRAYVVMALNLALSINLKVQFTKYKYACELFNQSLLITHAEDTEQKDVDV